MKIRGSYTFDAPRARVWKFIHNPTSLMQVIPGCRQIDQVNPTEYRGQIKMHLPVIVGRYQTYVKLIELKEPDYCRFDGEISGRSGSIKGTALFRLREVKQGTIIEYEGQGLIDGPLARLNDRFAAGLAKTLIQQGLAKLDKQIQNKKRNM